MWGIYMILITGLTGTSGSAFYDVLCRERYSEKIRVFVRKTTDLSLFENSPLDLEFVFGDLHDPESLRNAMAGCETIFHIASKGMVMEIADAVLQTPSVKHVILVSSTIVYSKFYKNSKLNIHEPIVRDAFSKKGIHYVLIRPTMIFGTPNDHNISVFIRWFERFSVFPIVKHGKATISPISRLDVAEAYWLVLKNIDQLKRNEYIVSGKDSMTLLEMFKTLTRLQNRNVRFINIPFPLAKLAVNLVYYLSFKKIDYLEKLDRLAEDRAYPHDAFSEEFGFDPPSFAERVAPLIKDIQSQ